jgi:CCR4-NOT transcriptional complex subunit CAF120
MTSSPQPATLHWESRNGYVPPPRFQQLRAQDNQQQRVQNQSPAGNQPPPTIQGASSQPSAEMAHSRTPSFFGFRTNKQPADNQHQRAQSASGPGNMRQQQYLPPSSNTLAPIPRQPIGQGQPLSQNIPVNQPQAAPQQQLTPKQLSNQQPLPPLPPQSQQPSQQQQPQTPPQPRPQPQPQQSSMNSTPNGSQQGPVTRSPSINGAPQAPAPSSLHPEIRSVVQLTVAHAHKVYFSGPLVRRFERQPDGQKPHKDEGWIEVWAQLGGTTLSVWDMKEIQEASKQGREVPPSYINVTDAVSSFFSPTPFHVL